MWCWLLCWRSPTTRQSSWNQTINSWTQSINLVSPPAAIKTQSSIMLNLKIDDWCRAITFSSEYICMRGWDIDLSVVLKDGIQDLRPKISHWYPPTSEPVKQPTTKIEAGKISYKLQGRKKNKINHSSLLLAHQTRTLLLKSLWAGPLSSPPTEK